MILDMFIGTIVLLLVLGGIVPSYYKWLNRRWKEAKGTNIVLVTYSNNEGINYYDNDNEPIVARSIMRVGNKGLEELRASQGIEVKLLNKYKSADWGVYY